MLCVADVVPSNTNLRSTAILRLSSDFWETYCCSTRYVHAPRTYQGIYFLLILRSGKHGLDRKLRYMHSTGKDAQHTHRTHKSRSGIWCNTGIITAVTTAGSSHARRHCCARSRSIASRGHTTEPIGVLYPVSIVRILREGSVSSEDAEEKYQRTNTNHKI